MWRLKELNARFFLAVPPSVLKGFTERHQKGFYLFCAVMMVLILGLDLKLPLGVAIVMLYNAVILICLRTRNRRFIIVMTVVASLFTICPIFHKAPIDGMWKVMSNRGLALFSIWVACYLGLQRQTTEETQESAFKEREKAFEEVRVLRGFLPICASCKKIRNLEGSWTLLEKYITEHSEAEFTHGLCPDCTKKLFPQFFENRNPPRKD